MLDWWENVTHVTNLTECHHFPWSSPDTLWIQQSGKYNYALSELEQINQTITTKLSNCFKYPLKQPKVKTIPTLSPIVFNKIILWKLSEQYDYKLSSCISYDLAPVNHHISVLHKWWAHGVSWHLTTCQSYSVDFTGLMHSLGPIVLGYSGYAF